ncbi:helix-turn-helix domain-containing protein [Streptomyces sp. NPDC057950]|uniref:helix-turn-helix domain-containing protein n=1 Tax=Streptomyces sp. NPDC057950 TaxID=3346288 RepID=UPI0036E76E90
MITRDAYRLFAERGYGATSIADIATEAEVAPRTVTLHFRSEQDVAFAHFHDSVQRLTERLSRALLRHTHCGGTRALAPQRKRPPQRPRRLATRRPHPRHSSRP